MKKLVLLLALLVPVMANAMKIDTDEIDEFTGKRVMMTSWESFFGGNMHIRFRYQNERQYLDFKMLYDGSIVIAKDSKLLLKSTTDDITEFVSTETAMGAKGAGATGLIGSGAWGVSVSYCGNVDWFCTNLPRLMRIYATDGYIDKNISEKDGYKLQKLASLFIGTLNGDNSFKVITCNIQYLRSPKGKNKWEVMNEEYLKEVLASEIDQKTAKWREKSDNKFDYDVKIKKQK